MNYRAVVGLGVRPLLALAVCAAFVAACAGNSITNVDSTPNQSISVALNHEVDITLGNIGPEIYADPPAVSSTALVYLDVSVVPPFTPGGPTQRFRFRAVERGLAVVTFHRVLGDSVVSTIQDTVHVH